MPRNPGYYAQLVDSPASFLTFLAVLREHREAAEAEARAARTALAGPPEVGPGGWENWTIGEFLEAMDDFAQDADLPSAPSWRDVARLLLAGKGYE